MSKEAVFSDFVSANLTALIKSPRDTVVVVLLARLCSLYPVRQRSAAYHSPSAFPWVVMGFVVAMKSIV